MQEAQRKLSFDRQQFEEKVSSEWFEPPAREMLRSTRVKLNIGGQIFESTAAVLSRDRFSLLAAICRYLIFLEIY